MSGLLFGEGQKALKGPPDELPQVPKQVDLPPLAAEPKSPGNAPGSDDKTMGAGASDEKRRILKMMPQKTTTKYAGDNPGAAPVEKKRLLGGAIGKQTTGD